MVASAVGRARVRVIMLCVVALALTGCDWSQFGFDNGNSRANPGESTISVGNVGALKAAFTGATGGTLFSSPAIVNHVAYVGSTDGKLYAFDAAGGTATCPNGKCQPLWTANLQNTAPGSPTVAGGIVYITTPGSVFAFDQAAGNAHCTGSGSSRTCTPLWQVTLGAGNTSDPLVADGTLYLQKGATLRAFNASTGASLWSGTGAGLAGARSIAAANGIVYLAGGNLQGVWAFDAAAGSGHCTGSGSARTCTPLWSTAGTSLQPTRRGGVFVTVAGGRLYTADQYGLYVFDAAGSNGCSGSPRTCAPLWSYNVGANEFNPLDSVPAVANGNLYVANSNGSFPLLEAFDATSCTAPCGPRWVSTTLAALGSSSSPAVAHGVVFLGSRDGSVYSFDASGCGVATTCSPLWSKALGVQVNSSPAVSNGTVYVGADDHALHAFK